MANTDETIITLEEAQRAWSYCPKGRFSKREKDDLSEHGQWTTLERQVDNKKVRVPVLKGWRYIAIPNLNSKQNISFVVEKYKEVAAR